MDLFEYGAKEMARTSNPLAEKMRPRSLKTFVGQTHVVKKGALSQKAIEKDRLFSMILWGPPGCGKTTLAKIMARETQSYFVQFSAVLSGVKEIREVIQKAKEQQFHRKKTVLFVDEIHRFNKAQQDAFLHHVESGLITLIGATTENPSFEVIPPLLSRCRVILLKPLSEDEIGAIIDTAILDQKKGLGNMGIRLEARARKHLIRSADGDARAALNGLELVTSVIISEKSFQGPQKSRTVGIRDLEHALQKKALRYDKDGEEHYNLISAFHKSLRGSDPDAAIYWLGRMLEAGEDPLYVCRRMIRFASEDVGNADPLALQMSVNAFEAFKFIGPPEGELALVQAAVYLATAPKSNRIYTAYKKVRTVIRDTGSLPVPMHIRNAPTGLMKTMGYGKGYKYVHDYKDGYVPEDYLPKELTDQQFYFPTEAGHEKSIKQRLAHWKRLKEKAKHPSDLPDPVKSEKDR